MNGVGTAGLSSWPTIDFLDALRQRNVKLWVDEGRLRFRAPRGAFSDELRSEVQSRRDEILDLLNEVQRRTTIEPAARSGEIPLSFAQERLWFLDRVLASESAYNLPFAVRLRGRLDLSVLTASLGEIVRRHEALRTVFAESAAVAGKSVQIVAPALRLDPHLVDVSALDEECRENTARELGAAEGATRFDLERGPLVRFCVVRLSAEDHLGILTIHHIVSDAWSLGVFVRELTSLYEAFTKGRFSPLPELPVQYADFALWQRRWLTEERLEAELIWWQEQLAGAPQVLELPTDRPRPPVRSWRGAAQRVRWRGSLHQGLEVLSRRQGTTLFMTLLAAFQHLLGRLAHQNDLLVGSPIANRNRPEIESLIGFFVNTLVLRGELADDLTFADLLSRVRERTLAAYAHQDMPFEKLVEALQDGREASRSPLFQVMFHLQNTPMEELRLPGLTLSFPELATRTSKFDLTLETALTGEGLTAAWIFDTDLFDAVTIRRLSGHLETFLEAVVDAGGDERRLSDLPLLTPAERHQERLEWNDQPDYPEGGLVHHFLEARAELHPETTAVVLADRCLSYLELDARADRLAVRLRDAGVGPGVRVGLFMERSCEMVVGLYGILKAGAAYVPLDPDHPTQRLAYLQEDAGIPVLLTNRRWLCALPAAITKTVETLCVDDRPWNEPRARPPAGPTPEEAAYVIYTSGSTGRPKGVVVSHRAVSNRLTYSASVGDFLPQDRCLQRNALGFDISVVETFTPLSVGATLILSLPGSESDSAYLVELIRRERISNVTFVPSMYQLLLEDQGFGGCRTLRKLASGGEVVPGDLPERLLSQLDAELHNRYGPTEATVAVISKHCRRGELGAVVPIGRPITQARVYLLDEHLRAVPRGAPGGILVGGLPLARGYLRRPRQTAELFLPDPTNRQPGSRLFDTGDLGRFRHGGDVEFLGRRDHQVKIRGFRIELGEIEAALARQPEVRDALVTVLEDPPPRRLVSYLVPAAGEIPPAKELRRRLRRSLPEYMVPAAFVSLRDLPLTANGKVDRKALPVPQWTGQDRPEPRNEAEEALVRVFSEILGLERTGVRDNFFEMGGDSILSIQLVSRLRNAGWVVTPRDVFHHQSPEELAQVARRLSGKVVPERPVTGSVPLTPIQHWFFDLSLSERHHFNQSLLLELHRSVRAQSLYTAFGRLLEHHDALRLRFFRDASRSWRQEYVAPDGLVPFLHVDLSALKHRPAVPGEAAARVQASLDLEAGPLSRMVLFSLPGAEADRLLWVIHHLVVDGVSWRVLLEDLERLLRGEELPARTTSFRSWARRLEAYGSSEAAQQEAQTWLDRPWSRLRSLPVDRAGDNTRASARTVTLRLGPEPTRVLLEEAPRAYRNSVQEILLAALLSAMRDWTGSEVLALSLEGHGRQEELFEDVDLSRTVGWFTSLYPVILRSREDPGELLKSIKEELRSVPTGGVGYGILRWQSATGERLAAVPSPEVVFNYLGRLDLALSAGSLFAQAKESAGPAHSRLGRRSHLLEINARVLEGSIELTLGYSENLHDAATIEALGRSFRDQLQRLLEHCQSPQAGAHTPSDFPLANLDQDALDRLWEQRGRVEDIYPLSHLQRGFWFHHLFTPQGSGEYFEQIACKLSGGLVVDAFHRAWQLVVDRHPILRTALVWEDLEEPVQVVARQVDLPWREWDWREFPPAELETRLEAESLADIRRSFELTQAPLMRATLIRTGQEAYSFILGFHHLLLDGWSVSRVLLEVFAGYEALCRGALPDPAPVRPYRDYVAWLEEQDLTAAEAYWRLCLEGLTTPTLLAEVLPRPASAFEDPHDPRDYGERRSELPEATSRALAAWAGKHRMTLNTLVQGAWALLLSRYTGQGDVVFGITVSGRPAALPEVESMVGLFINTLPLRIRKASAQEALVAWLQQLQAQNLKLRDYEYSSLEQIQKWSQVPAGQALFDHILVFENYPVDAAMKRHAEALEISDVRTFERTNYPMNVVVAPGRRLSLVTRHSRRHFDDTTVRRMLDHFKHLLAAISGVDDPRRRIPSLPWMSEAQRHQLLVGWNDTEAAAAGSECLHELFEDQAVRAPDATALVFEERSLSYGELDGRANQAAHRLRSLGVGPGVMVGVYLERSPEMVVGLLGILKAGGAYVPLETSHPRERLEFMMEDAGARVFLDRAELSREKLESEPRSALSPVGGSTAAGLAYTIYTSGSTGKPKGVLVRHEPAVNLIDWVNRTFEVGPGDRMLFMTSLGFDLSVYDVFGILAAGGSIRIASAEDLAEPQRLVDLLVRDPITFWDSAPAALQQLVPLFPPAGGGPGAGDLRLVFLSGDWIPVGLPDQVRASFRSARVIALGGATEATIWSNFFPVEQVDPLWTSIPYGRPIKNARYFITDSMLEPCAAGIAGDLLIGGQCLAAGYLNRPALTAERFIPDPFSERHGRRMYRTGDRARFLADGKMEFLGRLDHQVKIRGFRIELGEIESRLVCHPEVKEAVVLAREDLSQGKALVAYVVAQGKERAVDGGELGNFLKGKLPEYMVPAIFVELDQVPLTPNGKVDRKALPKPGWQRRQEESFVARDSPVENLLAEIWAQVLGVERVGARDDFFELGGHSLLATQVVSRIRQTFHLEIPLRQLFEAPTVASLAGVVEEIRFAGGARLAPPIAPVSRQGDLPLSFAQDRLWFLDRMDPGISAYNLPGAIRLRGCLDVPRLRASLERVVRRHETLRTTFAETDSGPVQVIAETPGSELPAVDFGGLVKELRESEAQRLAVWEAGRSFDLTRGPLVRCCLVRLAEKDHLLLVNLHHIVSDGWSMGVMVRELTAFYRGRDLSPLPVQYADFAVWQRGWLRGEKLDQEVKWWRRELDGVPQILELSVDRPRPVVQSHRGATLPVRLPSPLVRELEVLSRRQGTTLFMTLLSAFQVLLSRYTRQDDLLVGSAIANRNRAEVEDLIGFFVNTLVLRGDLTGDPTLAELLDRTRERTLGAYAHQDLPFEKLVDELQPERDPARSPLFQAMFVVQNAPMGDLELPGLVLSFPEVETGTSKLDMTLSLAPSGEGWEGTLAYCADLFDAVTMGRFRSHYERLLGELGAHPQRPVGEASAISEAERHQLAVEWNDTAAACSRGRNLAELFEAQVERTPDAVAVEAGERSLSYRDLDRRAEALGLRLRDLGVGPDVPVGVCLDRSTARMVGILGVLKAGGAYVPLDPDYPAARLRFITEDLAMSVAVGRRVPELSGVSIRWVDPNAVERRVNRPPPRARPENLAYVLYTSGSTGVPKGVAVPHRAVVRLVFEASYMRIGAQEVFLQLAPLAFDASTLEIWGPLLHGGRLVMSPRRLLSPQELEMLLLRYRITTLWLTAGLFHQMVEENLLGLGSLRQLLAGGDALSPMHVRQVLEQLPGVRLINGYGPTESTTFTSCHPMHRSDRVGASVSIGRPITNTGIRLLGSQRRPLPLGVPGELCICGEGLARGYANRPKLTAERFVPDALGTGGRLYRTGDRARFLPDGTLEFLGRIDHQVKVRGFRIELGEIESVLAEHPAVSTAVVTARDQRLVAYVVLRRLPGGEGGNQEAAALRRYLRERLPDYMLPSFILLLEELPLTANGKVDRRRLPAPAPTAERDAGAVLAAPRTSTEELLSGIWAEVLGHGASGIGVDDDFFAMGGHSLLATLVVSRVRRTFGVDVALRTLFENPTVARLARQIETASRTELPPVRPVPRNGDLPLSFAQERLWFLDRMTPGNPAYNVPFAVRMRGALDVPALAASLGSIVRRHEALRTTFAERDGRPVQVIRPPPDAVLTVADLSRLPRRGTDDELSQERENEGRRLALREGRHPFDLDRGPLVRCFLCRLAPDDHLLVVNLHHIVSDGWSLGVTVRELMALYRGAPLPALPVQYADFAVWQRGWLEGERLEQEVEWWRRQLDGAPQVLELTTDRPRPPVQSHRGAVLALRLPSALVRESASVSRRQGVTLFMTLLSAFQLLLARYSHQDDLLVGSAIANRNRAEIEGLIGFFVNTLVLRGDLTGDPTFAELLDRTRERTLGAYVHQDLPFEKLVDELQPERDPARSPLFQAMFVVQNAPMGDLELPGLVLSFPQVETGTSKFDMTLSLMESGEECVGTLAFCTDIFDAVTLSRLWSHYERLLGELSGHPQRPVWESSPITEAEKHQLSVEWNDTVTASPRQHSLVELFESQVAQTPHAVALLMGRVELSYTELNAKVNRLARHLRQRGVGPEVLVGLAMGRSPEMVIGMLALLKTGGPWVPIAPDTPRERMAFLLEDSRPSLLLDAAWFEQEEPELIEESAANPCFEIHSGHPAYLLYTSGSTGRPKGVVVSRRSLDHLICWMREAFPLNTREVVLQKTPTIFDASVWEIFLPLVTGARLVLASSQAHRDPTILARELSLYRITVLQAVPTLLRLLVEEPTLGWSGHLGKIFSGGEALTSALACQLSPRAELINLYGPTESTVQVLYHAGAGRGREGVPLGRPAFGIRIHLLDRGCRPVPIGVAGHLHIGGEQLARGYLGRPARTAAAFIPDPFVSETGGRLYRTGDLARYLTDGMIEFLGRIDHQVKVRGWRIELGEIEAALEEHPAVRTAVVLVRETRLLAWVVAQEKGLSAETLRDHLRHRLPQPMVPSFFLFRENLPFLPNGKVDRQRLMATAGEGASTAVMAPRSASCQMPRTVVEEIVAAVWEEVLGIHGIGPDDDFFDLGGHSLLATQVAGRLRRIFGSKITVRVLFEAPKLSALASQIEVARQDTAPEAPLLPVPRDEPIPLSFAQQRLWFLDRLVPENPFYNMPGAVRLRGPLRVASLVETFQALVDRHESLRTVFPLLGETPVQKIDPAFRLDVPLVDLESLPETRRQSELDRLTRSESRQPFDLGRGPLLRVRLVRLGHDQHELLFNLHHIISDGWSMQVLYRELSALYEAFSTGRASPLVALPVQYADFAAWQRQWLRGDLFHRQLDYWRQRLAGIPQALALPWDHPRPAIESFRGAQQPFRLSPAVTTSLRALARTVGATSSMTLLLGFKVLLARYTGQDDVPVGMAIANRQRPELESLIGFFVNTLVLRSDLSAGAAGRNPSFRELLVQEREAALGAYAHQDLPFERLVEELDPERDLARNPLIQVMFGYQNYPHAEIRLPDLTLSLSRTAVDSGSSKFDLTLFLVEDGDELRGTLEYNSDLFASSTIQRMEKHFRDLLEASANRPETPIHDLPVLSGAERHQLTREWNDTRSEHPREVSLQELFEVRTKLHGATSAVVFGAAWLSYGELNRRANHLAHRLRELGVGPESRVGLCLPRSLELVVAMVGVVKAGGAYVPLDRGYPRQRLELMMKDSGIEVLVGDPGTPLPRGSRMSVLPVEEERRRGGGSSGWPEWNPPVATGGGSLLYVIYTSGSTGRPKGVGIIHRSVSRLILGTDYVQVDPSDRVAQLANASFDAVTFEVWGPLLTGGRLVILTKQEALSPAVFGARVREYGLTAMFLTSALFNQIVRERPETLLPVHHLIVGGEAVDPHRAREMLGSGAARRFTGRLLNGYGPTESTTFAAWYLVEKVLPGATTVPIGRPLANTRLDVSDRRLRPSPPGVVGELCLGGEGLARGYLGRPALTAKKFVPDTRSGHAGERLYRTGDLVRQRPDGAVEYLERIDHQVKIRGFRIELGEIEAALAEHPEVDQSVVAVHQDPDAGKRLVAYVLRQTGVVPEQPSDDQVSGWSAIFDDLYQEDEEGEVAPDTAFNIVGWKSTYTDEPLPQGEMREWLDDTVGRLRSLAPRRVLEIGCGTGLLLHRLAPESQLYWGTDVSRQVLDQLARQTAESPQVKLLHRPAEDFDGVTAGMFDTVILNSVVQYFPSAEYLAEVLENAVRAVRPGGAIFLGDVRSLPLLPAFHLSLELHGSEPNRELKALRRGLSNRALGENELVVDPRFFTALACRLPEIGRVEIHPKRGRAHNELTCFRYQVVLRIGPASEVPRVPELDWERAGLSLETLRRQLVGERPEALVVRNIPNARLERTVATLRLLATGDDLVTVGDLDARLGELEDGGVDPQAMWDLSRSASVPYEVELGWALPGPEGRFDAALVRRDLGADPAAILLPTPPTSDRPRHWREYCSDPLRGRFARRLAPELREHLRSRLPEYMVPQAFVLLETLPLTPNGKLDRRALPDPEPVRRVPEAGFVAPRNATETALAEIWEQVLGAGRVGAHDDFFALGGHSLLATQVVSRIREQLGVELPLRVLFETATIAGLAEELSKLEHERSGPELPPILPVPRDGDIPLSFAQERLWFLEHFEPAGRTYNEGAGMWLEGALDLVAFRRSLDEISHRHESLRTSFPSCEGRAMQRISEPAGFPLLLVDLTHLPEIVRRTEVRRAVGEMRSRPFDLATGPLARGLLLREAPKRHGVMWSFHHIIFDGWSIGVFLRELAALYEAFRAGKPSPLQPLSIQYADFAVWQRQWLESCDRGRSVLERQLTELREKLSDAPVLELPTDRPRPSLLTSRGAAVSWGVEAPLTEALRTVARHRGATLYMGMLAAFVVLLQRLSGQNDLMIGTPVASRSRAEIEGLIGFFVNMLVLRTDLSQGSPGRSPVFSDLVDCVRKTALAAYSYQDIPFEKLMEHRSGRDLRRSPLVQVSFQLLDFPVEMPKLAGLETEALSSASTVAKFELSLNLAEGEDGMSGQALFRTELFDGSTVTRWLRHLEVILENVIADPECRLDELELWSVAERHQILREWGGDTDYTAPSFEGDLVPQQLGLRASRAAAAVALATDGAALTYGELQRRAERLACSLRLQGVGPEVRVGIALERSVKRVVAVWAVLAAGGAWVPIDPALPRERKTLLLEDAGLGIVLTDGENSEGTAFSGISTLLLDSSGVTPAPAGPASERLLSAAHPAYVIYTSGSTGRPKGVMVTHRALRNHMAWQQDNFPLEPGDAVLHKTPFSFDASVCEVLAPLLAGARLVLAYPGEERDVASLTETMARHRITALQVVPTLLRLLAPKIGQCGSLRRIYSGGEPLSAGLVHQVRGNFHGDLINVYGPTETAMRATCGRVGHGGDNVPVGRPITNARTVVASAALTPVPLGGAGELLIGGVGVSRGYLGRPRWTAARFVPDPFARYPGDRLYRSGDRMRQLADGRLEFLERLDHQVKLRGFRIEPGEIETVLHRHPDVEAVAVCVRENSAGDPGLLAWVVMDEGGGPGTVEALRSFAHERLPAYMVPQRFLLVEALPLLPSGKVDRTRLPAAEPEVRDLRDRPLLEPRDRVELELVRIWEELLEVAPVGVEDDFFELGGHSLLALRLTARIEAQLGSRIPLAVLFQGATVAALATFLRRGPGSTTAPSSPLVTIRSSGSRASLFFVHPVGGHVLCYLDLARSLGPEQPFHALQARGLGNHGEAPLETIPEMAAHYVDAVRAVEKEGPYHLGGWSMGGVIAYEIARQLLAAGQEVAWLALVDSQPARLRDGPKSEDDPRFWAGFARELGINGASMGRVSWEALGDLSPAQRRRTLLGEARSARLLPPDLSDQELETFFRVFRANVRALHSYTPRPLAVRTVLFEATERLNGRDRSPAQHWQELVLDRLEVHRMPGDHHSMLRGENAGILARQIRAHFDRTSRRARP